MNAQHVAGLKEEFAGLKILGGHRRFLVARMGSTGSTWLAKLLNSHPDVFCTHEQVLSKIHPRNSARAADISELIATIATMTHHGAYQAAGDVGSAWLGHALALRGRFSTALLLRHPARLLNTRLKIYPTDQSHTVLEPGALDAVRHLWGIETSGLEMLDRVFIHDLLIFAIQSQALGKVDYLVRFEDLLEPDYTQEFVNGLTGVHYDFEVIARSLASPVNRRASAGESIEEIVERFTPRQREWYQLMLGEVAPCLGYELYADVTPTTRAPNQSCTR